MAEPKGGRKLTIQPGMLTSLHARKHSTGPHDALHELAIRHAEHLGTTALALARKHMQHTGLARERVPLIDVDGSDSLLDTADNIEHLHKHAIAHVMQKCVRLVRAEQCRVCQAVRVRQLREGQHGLAGSARVVNADARCWPSSIVRGMSGKKVRRWAASQVVEVVVAAHCRWGGVAVGRDEGGRRGGASWPSRGASPPSITWLLFPLTDFCWTIGSQDRNQIIKRSRLALFSCHMH